MDTRRYSNVRGTLKPRKSAKAHGQLKTHKKAFLSGFTRAQTEEAYAVAHQEREHSYTIEKELRERSTRRADVSSGIGGSNMEELHVRVFCTGGRSRQTEVR